MKTRILRTLSGIAAALALAFSAGVPLASAGGNAWMGIANGGTVMYRTNQWYTSSTISPGTQNMPGTINEISIRATVTGFPSFAYGIDGQLCADLGAYDHCEYIDEVISGTTINGTTTDFNQWPPSTSFYFKWIILDTQNRPIPSSTVIARQTINVFYE